MFRISKALLLRVVDPTGTPLRMHEFHLAVTKYWTAEGHPMVDLAKLPDARVDSYPPSYRAERFEIVLDPRIESFIELQIDASLS